MGTMTYYADGEAVVYNLIASRAIEVRENAPKSYAEIVAEVENDPNPFPPLSLEFVLVHVVLPIGALVLVIRLLMRVFRRRHRHFSRTPRVTRGGMK